MDDMQGVEQVYLSPSTPSIPHNGQCNNNAGTSTVLEHAPDVLRPYESVQPSAAVDERKLNWGPTASATVKLLLRGVRDSADASGPLKSVVGGLCFILENCERTKANKQAIESLAPQVEALAERLCVPVSEGDVKERERRMRLDQRLQDIYQDLAPLEEHGKVEGFFNNVENAGKLGGLVEDFRGAVVGYQTWLQQDIYDESCQLLIGLTLSPNHPREPLPGLYEPIPAPTMMNNPVHMTPEMYNYRQSMQRLHRKGMGPPLTANNAGSPMSNPSRTSGSGLFNAGNTYPATGPGQGPPTNSTPAIPGAPPSVGADATSGPIELQQTAMDDWGELTWDIGDFDQIFLRQDPGDLNFERDFGQWFNPGGDVTLDMK